MLRVARTFATGIGLAWQFGVVERRYGMRRLVSCAVFCSAAFLFTPAREAAAGVAVGVSVNFFHDALSPYGDWIQSARFGLVWTPRHVAHDWRPYTYGHWVYTDDDWTWVSDDEWGWATGHYGRWYFDPAAGWLWVPGDEWAPAWVVWRSGGGYVGWAPMPPDVDAFHIDAGLVIDPFAFSFVEVGHLCEPHVYRRMAPVGRNVTFVRVTENITHYAVHENRIVNRGIDVERVERARGHAVPRVRIHEVASAAEVHGGKVRGGEVGVFRPRVEPSARPLAPPGRPAATVRPEDLSRRHERERHDLQSAEDHERKELRKIHEREDKHPPVASEAGQAPGRHEPARPSDARTHATGEPRRPTVDREQLRSRHEVEMRAQAQHEERERTALHQRQEREQQAAKERHPAPGHQPKPHDDKKKKK
jgi:hypothetical protein